MVAITLGRTTGEYARDVYTINRDPSGISLVCLECPHTVHVKEFDDKLGSCRTQAARAMLKHVLKEHDKVQIGKPNAQTMER